MRAVVRKGCTTFLLVYHPTWRLAALIDVTTGVGQVAWNFTADVPNDERGPITFEAVDVLDGDSLHFLWTHRGATWSQVWPGGQVIDLSTFIVVDSATRQRTTVFRWR